MAHLSEHLERRSREQPEGVFYVVLTLVEGVSDPTEILSTCIEGTYLPMLGIVTGQFHGRDILKLSLYEEVEEIVEDIDAQSWL